MNGKRRGVRRLGIINRALATSWDKGLTDRPVIEPDALLRATRRATGLDNFGDRAIWHGSLTSLCGALHDDARLNALGTAIAYGQIRAILRDRLLARAMWRRHPEIVDVPITAPIIVVGQMRSGTTRMQRLLSSDPALDHTRFFESWNPVPLRRSASFGDDRRWRARLALVAIRALNPDFAAIHPADLDAPDEEIGLNSHALFGSAFEAQWRIPGFARYCEDRDTTPVYREFRQLLQMIRWLRGDRGDRPWVIKLPQMTQDLATVLALFPDARLVVLSRAPDTLLASSASLVENQMRLQSYHVDPRWIGAEWARKLALREARTRAALDQFAGPQAHVDYSAIDADWQTEMRRIYRTIGQPWHGEAECQMIDYVARSARRPLRHSYRLDRYAPAAVTP